MTGERITDTPGIVVSYDDDDTAERITDTPGITVTYDDGADAAPAPRKRTAKKTAKRAPAKKTAKTTARKSTPRPAKTTARKSTPPRPRDLPVHPAQLAAEHDKSTDNEKK